MFDCPIDHPSGWTTIESIDYPLVMNTINLLQVLTN